VQPALPAGRILAKQIPDDWREPRLPDPFGLPGCPQLKWKPFRSANIRKHGARAASFAARNAGKCIVRRPKRVPYRLKGSISFCSGAPHLAWDSVRRQGDGKPGWDKAEEPPFGNPLRNDLRAAPQNSIYSKNPQTQARLGGPGGSRTRGVLSDYESRFTVHANRLPYWLARYIKGFRPVAML